MTDKKSIMQEMAACYGAGQIKQGLIAGEYPPPEVSLPLTFGPTVTGRFTRRGWPFDYSTGPSKLADLQNVTTQQAEAATRVILGADFAELERRVMAWHAEVCENLRAQGYRPAGDGPLSDTWIKDEEKPE